VRFNEELYTKGLTNDWGAYVLYYVRENDIPNILELPCKQDIPNELNDYVSRQERYARIAGTRLKRENSIYMITEDTVFGWDFYGVMPSSSRIYKEPEISENTDRRISVNIGDEINLAEFSKLLFEQIKSEYGQDLDKIISNFFVSNEVI
jgi:hypothetical protein